jgi:membrane associated rhomboid family serine protease
MGLISSVFWQGIISPITSLFILIISWVWVKVFLNEWDPRLFSISYTDVLLKGQYWRIIATSLCHNSIFVLLLNAITIWNLRYIEQKFGSWFFFRYSVLLLCCEPLLTFALVNLTIRYTPQSASGARFIFANLNTLGSSGLVLAWLAFQAVTSNADKEPTHNFQLLGLFNFNPHIAPLIMVSVYYLCLPRTHAFSNLNNLLCGFLLGAGMLQFIPGLYWSLCFLLNLVLLILSSIFRGGQGVSTVYMGLDDSESDGDGVVLEVPRVGVVSENQRPAIGDIEENVNANDDSSDSSSSNINVEADSDSNSGNRNMGERESSGGGGGEEEEEEDGTGNRDMPSESSPLIRRVPSSGADTTSPRRSSNNSNSAGSGRSNNSRNITFDDSV